MGLEVSNATFLQLQGPFHWLHFKPRATRWRPSSTLKNTPRLWRCWKHRASLPRPLGSCPSRAISPSSTRLPCVRLSLSSHLCFFWSPPPFPSLQASSFAKTERKITLSLHNISCKTEPFSLTPTHFPYTESRVQKYCSVDFCLVGH